MKKTTRKFTEKKRRLPISEFYTYYNNIVTMLVKNLFCNYF